MNEKETMNNESAMNNELANAMITQCRTYAAYFVFLLRLQNLDDDDFNASMEDFYKILLNNDGDFVMAIQVLDSLKNRFADDENASLNYAAGISYIYEKRIEGMTRSELADFSQRVVDVFAHDGSGKAFEDLALAINGIKC